jgi:uncharacterized protein YlzI (FlbEa/FlbD family)
MGEFTDRFMVVPIYQVNPDIEELIGKEGDKTACVMLINPRRIESMNETIPRSDFRPDNKIWTNVTMESGDNFIVRITLEEFKNRLNSFNK